MTALQTYWRQTKCFRNVSVYIHTCVYGLESICIRLCLDPLKTKKAQIPDKMTSSGDRTTAIEFEAEIWRKLSIRGTSTRPCLASPGMRSSHESIVRSNNVPFDYETESHNELFWELLIAVCITYRITERKHRPINRKNTLGNRFD